MQKNLSVICITKCETKICPSFGGHGPLWPPWIRHCTSLDISIILLNPRLIWSYNTEPYSTIGKIVDLYNFTSTFRLNVCVFLLKRLHLFLKHSYILILSMYNFYFKQSPKCLWILTRSIGELFTDRFKSWIGIVLLLMGNWAYKLFSKHQNITNICLITLRAWTKQNLAQKSSIQFNLICLFKTCYEQFRQWNFTSRLEESSHVFRSAFSKSWTSLNAARLFKLAILNTKIVSENVFSCGRPNY